MQFNANDEDMKLMFKVENESRRRYSEKIRNKEEKSEGYYEKWSIGVLSPIFIFQEAS